MIFPKTDIVLVNPQIPQNSGNIGRTCIATNSTLHLVKPLGFEISDAKLKRAGLDYWHQIDLKIYENIDELEKKLLSHKPFYLFSRFATKLFWDVPYEKECALVFGSETTGLPETFKNKYPDRLLKIPTPGNVRSLNLSTSVGIALYQSLSVRAAR